MPPAWVVFGIAGLCLWGVVGVGIGSAQPDTPTNTTVTPPQPPTTPNASIADNGPNPFLSPEAWAKDVAKAIAEGLTAGVSAFISTFNRIVFGLPTPGSFDNPESWTNPDNGWWPGVWATYLIFTPIGFFMSIVAGILAMSKSPVERRKRLKEITLAGGMILFGFYLVAGVLHTANIMAIALAPSANEFVQTPGNITKLGVGVFFGLLLIFVQSAVVLVGIVVLFMQWFLIHVLVALWPFFWGLRALPIDVANPFGQVGIAGLSVLVLLKIFQAAILRFLFLIPWDVGNPETVLFSLIGTVAGLFVATILLPIAALKKAVPAAMVMAGTKHSPSPQRIETLKGRARERFGAVGDRYGSGTTTTSTSASDRRQIGEVQRRMHSYSRPGGRPGAQTRSGTAVGPIGGGFKQTEDFDNKGYE